MAPLVLMALMVGLVPLVSPGPVAAADGLVVSIGDASVHEGDTGDKRSAKLAVSLSQPSTTEVLVSYVVADGTATAGVDYKDFKGKTKTLKFKPSNRTGLTPTTKFVSIPAFPDTDDEGDETAAVTITDVTTGYTIGDGSGTATIVDDDPGSGLRMAVGDASMHEGDVIDKPNKVQLWVTLTEPAPVDVSFDMTITGGTATLDDDYEAKSPKTYTIKQGKFKKAITLKVLPDTDVENDETIEVTLSSGHPTLTITDPVGVATITDDDGGETGPDEFAIAVGDVVSDGVPGAGAGNIEFPGVQDVYTFEATAGQVLFFDVLTDPCSVSFLEATLTAPSSAAVFSDRSVVCGSGSDFGPFTVTETGTHTLTVDADDDSTGAYSFSFIDVPDAQNFAIEIGDVVSDGVPAVGAGNIEFPGVQDIYTFEATAGQVLFFDVLTDPCSVSFLEATLTAPSSAAVFSDRSVVCGSGSDFGPFAVTETGTHTLTVDADDDSTGAYSFTFLELPPVQGFVIDVGEVVSDGLPAAGAGNIESPGVRDVYSIDFTAGQNLFFDVLTGCGIFGLDATLTDPNDVAVFSERSVDCATSTFNDFGPFVAGHTGTYTLTVGGLDTNDDSTGTYSFVFLDVPAADAFVIDVGDVVGNGLPGAGAGNIESPGVRDVYTIDLVAGQNVFFDVLTPCVVNAITATLLDPMATPVFSNRTVTCGTSTFNDFGPFVAPATGTYTLTVGGLNANNDAVGTYSLGFLEVPAPDEFAIATGDVVSNGVPAAGAGNIEAPGARDLYTFEATAGQMLFFDVLTPCAVNSLTATLVDPNDTPIFSIRSVSCGISPSNDFGPFAAPATGTYTLTVGGLNANNDEIGTYSFTVTEP